MPFNFVYKLSSLKTSNSPLCLFKFLNIYLKTYFVLLCWASICSLHHSYVVLQAANAFLSISLWEMTSTDNNSHQHTHRVGTPTTTSCKNKWKRMIHRVRPRTNPPNTFLWALHGQFFLCLMLMNQNIVSTASPLLAPVHLFAKNVFKMLGYKFSSHKPCFEDWI